MSTPPGPDLDPRLQPLVDEYVRQGYQVVRHTATTAVLDRRPGALRLAVAAVLGALGGEDLAAAVARRPTDYLALDPDGQPRADAG